MNKKRAFELLGVTTATEVARLVGITPQAVNGWPDVLTDAIADRVLAVLARRHLAPELIGGNQPQPDALGEEAGNGAPKFAPQGT